MKRLIVILISLLALGSVALGEGATLRFSSFAGGGHEYTVEVGDASIVRCEMMYAYEDHADEIEGASYDAVFSFTGLKPGATNVTIYGRSPIAENDDHIYTATVDEALHVTLTPVRSISTFYLYRNGEMYYPLYHITREPDGYYVSIDEGEAQIIATGAMEALMDVIDAYDVPSWDGFSESRQGVLDGEGFWLEFTLTDGTHVRARGDNAFPEHYFDAMAEIWNILTQNTEEEMKLIIGETIAPVTWEENKAVEALKGVLPLTIHMSMYGGFEQVGSIGVSLPREDEQITTGAGDIVLYSGNQLVIFYGSNSWAYTRLGHINLSAEEMIELLGNGDVEIGLRIE